MESPDAKIELKPQISPAQCLEVWNSKPHSAGIKLLARIVSLPEYDDDPVMTIWVEFLYQLLLFGKENKLTPKKTLAFFTAAVTTNASTIDCAETAGMSRQKCLRLFADELLVATKAMAAADRFSVQEVKLITNFFQETYIPTLQLHQYVFTREQVQRQSEAELFIHTPGVVPPLSSGVDVATMPPAEEPALAPVAAAPSEEVMAEPPAVANESLAPAAEAPAAAPSASDMSDPELAAAIAANVDRQVAALKGQMEQDFAAQEQLMLERIAALEAKLSSKPVK